MVKREEKIISFRVDGEQLLRLEEAAYHAGISPHEWAKRATIRELDFDNLLPKVALQTEVMRQELIEIRKDIAVATEGILVSGGKASNEQAARFVKANLRGE